MPKDEHVIERKLSPDRIRALHVTKAQIGVESGKDDLLGLSFQPDGGRTEAGNSALETVPGRKRCFRTTQMTDEKGIGLEAMTVWYSASH